MNNIFHKYKFVTAISITALLFGCGGGSDGSGTTSTPDLNPEPPPATQLIAMDGFSVTKPDMDTKIDLSSFIRGDNVEITDAYALDDAVQDCTVLNVEGSSLEVNATNGVYCNFEYQVRDNRGVKAAANLQVLATNVANPVLPPVSEMMTLDSSATTIDLPTALGSAWKTDFALNTGSVSVQGMDSSNEGSVTAFNNSVVFTPPTSPGWNRIVFTASDSAGQSHIGSVYVTISDSVNQAPTISDTSYDYNEAYPSYSLDAGRATSFNLGSLSGLTITEPDGQDWQLISVQSFTASVSVTDPNSVTNKSFNFNAGTVGEHIVSYIIADHYGGYSSGLFRVETVAYEPAVTWTALTVNNKTYSAPLTYTQGLQQGINVSPNWDNTVNNTISGFERYGAIAYCSSVGLFPTVNDMNTLRNNYATGSGISGDLNHWPKSKKYLAQDSGGVMVGYDLATGTRAPYDASQPYYMTCLVSRDMSMKMINTTIVANGIRTPLARLTMPNAGDKFWITKLGGTVSEEQVAFAAAAPNGRDVDISTVSTVAGTYRFQVAHNDDRDVLLTSPIVYYIADKETARFTSVQVDANWQPSDGISQNRIILSLKDANNNPIQGARIDVAKVERPTANVNVTTFPLNGLTDTNGSLTFNITSTVGGQVDVTFSYTKPSGGVVWSSTQLLAFENGRFPCVGGGYSCQPVVSLPSHRRKWFTAPPTMDYLNLYEYKNYKETYTGTGSNVPHGVVFPLFTQPQAVEWCASLARRGYNGRSNWTLVSKSDVEQLIGQFPNGMYNSVGWNAAYYIWTQTMASTGLPYKLSLYDASGNAYSGPTATYAAACVSE